MKTEATNLCYITFQVTIPSSESVGYVNGEDAYTKTTNQLKSAINSGRFDTNVQTYATNYNTASMNGVTSLGAQPTLISTTTNGSPTFAPTAAPTSSNDDDDSILPLWAIIVIPVGGFFFLVCLCAGAYFAFVNKKSDGDAPTGTSDKKPISDNPINS